MKKHYGQQDLSDMFTPKHDNGFEGEEVDTLTWLLALLFADLFVLGCVLAYHFNVTIY